MKKYLLSIVCIVVAVFCYAQPRVVDSLKQKLATNNDTLRLVICRQLNEAYNAVNQDSALNYAKKYVVLSQKLQYRLNEAEGMIQSAFNGEQSAATQMDLLLRAQRMLEENTDKRILPSHFLEAMHIPYHLHNYKNYKLYVDNKVMIGFSYVYWANSKHSKAYPYAMKAVKLANELQAPDLLITSNLIMGILLDDSDSALIYLKRSSEIAQKTGQIKELGAIYDFSAKCYANLKNYTQQLHFLRAALRHNLDHEMLIGIGWGYLGLGEFYQRNIPDKDSSLFYLTKAYQTATTMDYSPILYWSSKDLYDWYKKLENKDSVFKYADIMLVSREKYFNEALDSQFEDIDYRQELERSAIEKASEKYRSKIRLYLFLGGILVCGLLAIIFWRNSLRRKKAFFILQKQKAKTEQALQELKSTQQQLIQSEKMASLGELTAGIAHEIQNPLNFVNNFSEVNSELITEMKDELTKGNIEEAKTIADDINDNEQKIIFHGKRADTIVKGMLQHSRSSSGQKEPTNINALADEYFRLAYHGLRAKDKSFNATMKTDYDESIGNINIIPQDIGRAILNLITNAFYAVTEKKKQQPDNYEPIVTVSTKAVKPPQDGGGLGVLISVKDNGKGIPQKVLDKIFQPFFTTKPTGQGTGLGLSLSYDIVKAHGGDLKVNTKEGEGAEFIVQLPVNN